MKKNVAGVLLGVLMVLVVVSSANAAILLQQVQSTPYVVQVGGLSSEQAAQSIKENINLVGLKNVSLKVYREGNPAADFKVEIQTSTVPAGGGSPSGTVLAYGSVAGFQITTEWPGAVYKIELNTAITLSANTEYWIVAKPTSLVDNSNHFRVFISVTDPQGPYANGKIKYYALSAWQSNFGQQYDFYFILERPLISLRLPYTAGESWKVTQGNNSSPTHGTPPYENLAYAWDFSKPIGAGEDCNNDLGAPALAPADGDVVFANTSGDWGKTVIIHYRNGLYGRLAHLDSISISVGQSVLQGQQVGTVGNTGYTGDPPCAHIHYQTQDAANGSSVNPIGNATFIDPDVLGQNPDGVPTENNSYISSNTSP